MKKILTLIILAICTLNVDAQHYPLFTQYMNNGLVINPAYAGLQGVTDVTISHRRQWMGLAGSPVTTVLTANGGLKNKDNDASSMNKMNLGFIFSDDRIGPVSSQQVHGIYAYRLQAGKYKLSFGLQVGAEFSRVSWDKLMRNDQNDELILNASTRGIGFMSGAGVYLNSEKIFAGLSIPHAVNTGKKEQVGYGPLLLTGGYKFELKDSSAIKPSVLIRYTNGSPAQYDLNMSFYLKQKYGVGLSYRSSGTLAAILDIPFNNQFRFYYSYDFGMNKMRSYHSGSHEIILRYMFVKEPDSSKSSKSTSKK